MKFSGNDPIQISIWNPINGLQGSLEKLVFLNLVNFVMSFKNMFP